MAWPFSQPVPSFDTGFVTIPTGTATLSGVQQYLLGMHINNPTSTAIQVTVTDNAGGQIITSRVIAAHDNLPLQFNLMPVVGIKWGANVSGLVGKVWGY